MKCRDCRQARRHIGESVFCVLYGMIISEDHECDDERTIPPWDMEEENPPAVADADGIPMKGERIDT